MVDCQWSVSPGAKFVNLNEGMVIVCATCTPAFLLTGVNLCWLPMAL